MRSLTKLLWASILAGVLCAPVVRAQQDAPQSKTPPPTSQAGSQSTSSGQDTRQEPASAALGPSPVVTGGFAPRAGEIGDTTSLMRVGFNAGSDFDSNFLNLPVPNGWSTVLAFGGHFDLRRIRPNSVFMVQYVGGGHIDIQNTGFNSSYHEVSAAETIQFQRWSLSLNDAFSYLPESAFGFVSGGPIGTTPFNPTPLDPSVTPNQNIQTTQAARLSNTFLAQAQIMASERTTFTITGTYGILHYLTSGFLNTSNFSVGAGYNRRLNPRDVVGVSYAFNDYTYGTALPTVKDSLFLVTYGHQITGRLAFQAGVGPDINTLTQVGGPSLGTSVNIGVNAGVNYTVKRTNLTGAFSRGTSGGGGFLLAAITNTFTFSANRQLSRWWGLNGMAGYSSNRSLSQASPTTTSINGISAGGGLTRQLGETSSLFVNYNYFKQTTNGICGGSVCAAPLARHQITVGFSFDFRPIAIQ